jgi:hypothetical protein
MRYIDYHIQAGHEPTSSPLYQTTAAQTCSTLSDRGVPCMQASLIRPHDLLVIEEHGTNPAFVMRICATWWPGGGLCASETNTRRSQWAERAGSATTAASLTGSGASPVSPRYQNSSSVMRRGALAPTQTRSSSRPTSRLLFIRLDRRCGFFLYYCFPRF